VNISARLSLRQTKLSLAGEIVLFTPKEFIKRHGAKSGERKRINEIQKQAKLTADANRRALPERLVTLCERLLKVRPMQPRTPATLSKKPIF